jgi:aryl-alcohol dehydrogenase-like predicted oxidoreductase
VNEGINLFDTADVYGQGDSERELGWLLSRHKNIFIITKAGINHGSKAYLARALKPFLRPIINLRRRETKSIATLRDSIDAYDFGRDRLRNCVNASLRRLRTERIPGFLLHNPTVSVLRDPQIAALLTDLQKEGKIAHYGASVDTAEEVEAAVGLPGATLLQIPAGLLEHLSEHSCQQLSDGRSAVLVRGVLRHYCEPSEPDVGHALHSALKNPLVTSAIVGISTRSHLTSALGAVR